MALSTIDQPKTKHIKKRVFDLSVKTISARFVRIIWLTKFQWENLTIKELFSNNDDVRTIAASWALFNISPLK